MQGSARYEGCRGQKNYTEMKKLQNAAAKEKAEYDRLKAKYG